MERRRQVHIDDSENTENVLTLEKKSLCHFVNMHFYHNTIDNDEGKKVVEVRQYENLAHVSLYLSNIYHWEIVVDNEGQDVLIAYKRELFPEFKVKL